MTSTRYSFFLLLIAGVTGLVLGLGLDQVFLLHVGHDQSWYLYAANLELHGVQLNGPELVETNPPFAVWFSILPVLLGRLLHIGILDGFRVFFDSLVVVSIFWTTLLIKRFFSPSLVALWLFVLAQTIVALWTIRQDSLGQREHLLVLLILPYLVLAAARLRKRSAGLLESILIGLAASLAVCLKPQHILLVVATEALILFQVRAIRSFWHPVVIAFALGIVAYLISIATLGQTYVANVLPHLRMAYWGFNHPYYTLFLQRTPVFIGLALCWAVFLALRFRMRFELLSKVLGIAALASTVAYIQQHKGWTYQLIPAGMFTLLFISVTVIGLLEDLSESARFARPMSSYTAWATTSAAQGLMSKAVMLAVGCALIFGVLGWRFGHRADYFDAKKRELAHLCSAYPPGAAVAYISTQPWTMPVLIDQHKVLGQRFNHYWLLPAIVLGQDPEGNELHYSMPVSEVTELSQYQRRSTAEDLARWKPPLVVIDQCGPELCEALKREHYGSVLGWFSLDPEFEREWQHYQSAGKSGDLEAFHRVD